MTKNKGGNAIDPRDRSDRVLEEENLIPNDAKWDDRATANGFKGLLAWECQFKTRFYRMFGDPIPVVEKHREWARECNRSSAAGVDSFDVPIEGKPLKVGVNSYVVTLTDFKKKAYVKKEKTTYRGDMPMLANELLVYKQIRCCYTEADFPSRIVQLLLSTAETTGENQLYYECGERSLKSIVEDSVVPINRRTAVFLASETLLCIQEIHRLGFMHRRIEPESFYVYNVNNKLVVKIQKFDLSKNYLRGDGFKWAVCKCVNNLSFCPRVYHTSEPYWRIHDVESWVYMVVYFFNQVLLPFFYRLSSERDVYLMKKKLNIGAGTEELGELLPFVAPMLKEVNGALYYKDDLPVDFSYFHFQVRRMNKAYNITRENPLDWEFVNGKLTRTRDPKLTEVKYQPFGVDPQEVKGFKKLNRLLKNLALEHLRAGKVQQAAAAAVPEAATSAKTPEENPFVLASDPANVKAVLESQSQNRSQSKKEDSNKRRAARRLAASVLAAKVENDMNKAHVKMTHPSEMPYVVMPVEPVQKLSHAEQERLRMEIMDAANRRLGIYRNESPSPESPRKRRSKHKDRREKTEGDVGEQPKELKGGCWMDRGLRQHLAQKLGVVDSDSSKKKHSKRKNKTEPTRDELGNVEKSKTAPVEHVNSAIAIMHHRNRRKKRSRPRPVDSDSSKKHAKHKDKTEPTRDDQENVEKSKTKPVAAPEHVNSAIAIMDHRNRRKKRSRPKGPDDKPSDRHHRLGKPSDYMGLQEKYDQGLEAARDLANLKQHVPSSQRKKRSQNKERHEMRDVNDPVPQKDDKDEAVQPSPVAEDKQKCASGPDVAEKKPEANAPGVDGSAGPNPVAPRDKKDGTTRQTEEMKEPKKDVSHPWMHVRRSVPPPAEAEDLADSGKQTGQGASAVKSKHTDVSGVEAATARELSANRRLRHRSRPVAVELRKDFEGGAGCSFKPPPSKYSQINGAEQATAKELSSTRKKRIEKHKERGSEYTPVEARETSSSRRRKRSSNQKYGDRGSLYSQINGAEQATAKEMSSRRRKRVEKHKEKGSMYSPVEGRETSSSRRRKKREKGNDDSGKNPNERRYSKYSQVNGADQATAKELSSRHRRGKRSRNKAKEGNDSKKEREEGPDEASSHRKRGPRREKLLLSARRRKTKTVGDDEKERHGSSSSRRRRRRKDSERRRKHRYPEDADGEEKEDPDERTISSQARVDARVRRRFRQLSRAE